MLGIGLSIPGIIARGEPAVVRRPWFADNGATSPWYGATAWPNAVHYADRSETWIGYEAFLGGDRHLRIAVYDHDAGTWANHFAMANPEVDDDHGVPSIVRDGNGYVHMFGGSHNTEIQHVRTASANDPSEWTWEAGIGADGTYSKPVMVGSDLWLMFRGAPEQWRFRLIKFSVAASGDLTAGATTDLIELTAGGGATNGRAYASEVFKIGVELHWVMCRADFPDTWRADVYYVVYDTATDEIKNFAGTHSVALASTPISYTDMNNHFRLYNHDPNTEGRDVPTLQYHNGLPHIVFKKANGADLMHFYYDGTSWTTPVKIADVTGAHPNTRLSFLVEPNGSLALYYIQGYATVTRGGDRLVRKVWQGGSTWGSAETIFEREGSWGLDRVARVKDGRDDMALVFCEQDPDDGDAGAGSLKTYTWGSGGTIGKRPSTETFAAPYDTIAADVDFEGDTVREFPHPQIAFSTTIRDGSLVAAGLSCTGTKYHRLDGLFREVMAESAEGSALIVFTPGTNASRLWDNGGMAEARREMVNMTDGGIEWRKGSTTIFSAQTGLNNTRVRLALAWSANSMRMSVNGAAIVSGSPTLSVEAGNPLVAGNRFAGDRSLEGPVHRWVLWTSALSDADLIAAAGG